MSASSEELLALLRHTEAQLLYAGNSRVGILTGEMIAVDAMRAVEQKYAGEIVRLRAALLYARPIVVKWCYTQGNSAAFVVDTTKPLDDALNG